MSRSVDVGEDLGRAPPLDQGDDRDRPAPRADLVGADDLRLGVVAPLDQHVGADRLDQLERRRPRRRGPPRRRWRGPASTCARSSWVTTGRARPFRPRTERSVFRPTISRSPSRRASASRVTWPTWSRSKQPLVKTTRSPRARHSASRRPHAGGVADLARAWAERARRGRRRAARRGGSAWCRPWRRRRRRPGWPAARRRPRSRPAARPAVRVAITVSPAPETSKTSRATAGWWTRPSPSTVLIPCSPQVTTRKSSPSSSRSRRAGLAEGVVARVSSRPATALELVEVGGQVVAPAYLAKQRPLGVDQHRDPRAAAPRRSRTGRASSVSTPLA